MKLHRFIGDFNFTERSVEISDPNFVNQIMRVLRLGLGDMLVLSNGKKEEAEATIIDISRDRISLRLERILQDSKEAERQVILYVAILKHEHFEWVVEKATEIGVSEIVPLITKRTVKLDIRLDRLSKIIREAAEQSGRTVVPNITSPCAFRDALLNARENSLNILFDQKGVKRKPLHNKDRVGIFIGPEGGWDDEELEAAKKTCEFQNLGALTLRAETAAVIASYLTVHNL